MRAARSWAGTVLVVSLMVLVQATAESAERAGQDFGLPDLGRTADTIPNLPSPVPLDKSSLPRTSILGYPEGAKFPIRELLDTQTSTFFNPPGSTLDMADVVLRMVGPGTADAPTFSRAVQAVVPHTFAADSNITAAVLSIHPAVGVHVQGGDDVTAGTADADAGLLPALSAKDVTLRLALTANSSVHLTSPTNIDYGFTRLLEDRLEAALRAEGVRGGGEGGEGTSPAWVVRVLPTLNTTFLAPAAAVLLRLPRQTLVGVTVELALEGEANGTAAAATGSQRARLVPFDEVRQTALLEVIGTLLTNRTGLVQANLDGVVVRPGGSGQRRLSRRALASGASPDAVNATLFLLSASSPDGVRDALQTVLTQPDAAAVPASGDVPMMVQGLRLQGLAASGASLPDGAQDVDDVVMRTPRFALAALVGGNSSGKGAFSTPARRGGVIAAAALAALAGTGLLALTAALAIRSRHREVAGRSAKQDSDGLVSSAAGAAGAAGPGAEPPSSHLHGSGAGSSSAGPRSVQGGLFESMLGSGRGATAAPPTLRRAPATEDVDGGRGAAAVAPAAHAPSQSASTAADAEWEVDPADLTIATRPDGTDWLLGSGGAGAVFRGSRGGVGDVAIKLLQRGTPRDRAALASEARLLRKVSRDASIVQFYGACLTGPCPLLVLEYMAGGDLYAAIGESAAAATVAAGGGGGGGKRTGASPTIPAQPSVQWWAAGRGLALDVARGLHWLHSARVRHGDLKSSNILLTGGAGDLRAKIGDVGLAKVLDSHTTAAAAGGTYAWAAPEVLMNERCDARSDMYSFGVVLWEIATLGRPARGGMRPVAVPVDAPAVVADLIAACLSADPAARPTAKEAHDIIAASPATLEEEVARLRKDSRGDGGRPT